MQISDKYERLALEKISVAREDRQRRELYDPSGAFINPDGLLESVRERGVLQPVIVDRNGQLLAGERRLEASRVNGLPDIPVRYIDQVSALERAFIEIDENRRRSALSWRDEVASIYKTFELYKSQTPDATRQKFSALSNVGFALLSKYLRVGRSLGDEKIARCSGWEQAYNLLVKIDERTHADAVGEIIAGGTAAFTLDLGLDKPATTTTSPTAGTGNTSLAASAEQGQSEVGFSSPTSTPAPKELGVEETILHTSFLDWASGYTGLPFNFLHCDFPYGVDLFKGEWGGGETVQAYADTADTYWALVDCLCTNLDKLLAPSAHLMFWLSADLQVLRATEEFFRENAPRLALWPKPLIWHKTCNTGIVADSKRGPRHTYETALVFVSEDRPILKPIADSYGAPTQRDLHPSTKPEPVLRHFFQLFVDEGTRMLDPTSGGGSALRAAESLGAKSLGLELDESYIEASRRELKKFRLLRAAAR